MKIKIYTILTFILLIIPIFSINSVGLYDPLTGYESPESTMTLEMWIGQFINGFLSLFGALSFLMFVYGGFLWITSGGNSDKVKKGKDTIFWAIIAIVVIFSSYAIINFVFSTVSGLN